MVERIVAPELQTEYLSSDQVVWAIGSAVQVNRIPFDAALLNQSFPPPYTFSSLVEPCRRLGLTGTLKTGIRKIQKAKFPCLIELKKIGETSKTEADATGSLQKEPEILFAVKADPEGVWVFYPGQQKPVQLTLEALNALSTGQFIECLVVNKSVSDPDSNSRKRFGFSWFIPVLLKHKSIWRDVLVASLVIQLIALATPLFTQVIIDKVVVHQTSSTLIVMGIGLAVFMVFNAILTWARQYLVLHTGNRVDAQLGLAVMEHLFRLPLAYFENRPTGVIAARLHGVESVREFVSSSIVTLILDLPFLLIFVGIMFYYSVPLTLMVLGILLVIALLSVAIAPIFRTRMNYQFLLGARNQAFLTEYVSGLETVKSLQMEPQLTKKWRGYLASYLEAGFQTRQIANTYNVAANMLEQLMTLLVLTVGAWQVMNASTGASEAFTIGMLVAFQMFSGKLSQPILRLVGLWQQFQQASISVKRLADIMDAPAEHYAVLPSRDAKQVGRVEVIDVAFKYGRDRPYLYQHLNITLRPGTTSVLIGPSGSGKSTLAKLLQGFYQPAEGQIKIDGVDIRHLAANELRSYFGIVPQETNLFSGSIYDNLMFANPQATFDQVVQACKMAEIHAVVEGLPQGYQTEIGERGAGLSGGQKQRLAIARALLKRPKILIFDEATSALDSETAEQFARTINTLRRKVSMLFITHQLPKNLQIDEVIRIGEKCLLEVPSNGVSKNDHNDNL
ncbi:peptidase domain-containing ABC transporter [Herbaspirillum sp. YR522]|uniref:peptidase domain-containing ABC transporter n=1 Tax=Herbaspirillum sp. YR522 TaxID=1144342 RepID=UPI00026F4A35|nr:peptidase domain-containing ABC transporter [Herbaspirillum sp. YR522]EJN10298.1 ABC-type bacteriocin/lantibiotic exporter [Herbaspirillum sp. YR522]